MYPSRYFGVLENQRRAGRSSQILPDGPCFAGDGKAALSFVRSWLTIIAVPSLEHGLLSLESALVEVLQLGERSMSRRSIQEVVEPSAVPANG